MKRAVREILNTGLIVLGIFSAAFGLKGFLLSRSFIDEDAFVVVHPLADASGGVIKKPALNH